MSNDVEMNRRKAIGTDLFVLSEPHNEWIWEGDLPDGKRRVLRERFDREGETDLDIWPL